MVSSSPCATVDNAAFVYNGANVTACEQFTNDVVIVGVVVVVIHVIVVAIAVAVAKETTTASFAARRGGCVACVFRTVVDGRGAPVADADGCDVFDRVFEVGQFAGW